MMMRDHRTFVSFGFLICLWSAATVQSVSGGTCTCEKKSICEERCHFVEEPSLNCFGRRIQKVIFKYQCVWNLGRYSTYDLFIKQRTCTNVSRVNDQSMTSPAFSLGDATMTAYAIALDDQKGCIFAKFSSAPSKMIRCGPPNKVSFYRRSGQLSVTAEWEYSNVQTYYLKYRTHNTDLWNDKKVQSQDSRNCIVGNLSSSLSYDIQIECNETAECPQCQSSNIIRVQQEFTVAPVITEMDYHLIQSGRRRVVVKWEFVHSEDVENYNVTVQKASGEAALESTYFVHAPIVTLILCYSAYNISINAFNNAGPSPDAHTVIEVMEDRDWDDALNVSVNSNTSFSLSWSRNLAQKYHCYSVEWWVRGEQPMYETFYAKKNHYVVYTENVAFKPYRRYHFSLNARPEKDTCNLMSANNSDQTYGRTQAYLTEGTPLAAPGNVTFSNVTQSSFVINWSTVAEEDLQGFLQGYIIRYTDRLDSSEKNITVGPSVNSYELLELKSSCMYYVELSAYTVAGEGRRSDVMSFETHSAVTLGGMLAGILLGTIGLLVIIQLCCRLVQRSKNLLWPNIPNPYNSNAVQKIEGNQELMMADFEKTEEHVFVLDIKSKTRTARSFFQIAQDDINEELVPVMVTDSAPASSDCPDPSHFLPTSTLTSCTSAEELPIDDDPNLAVQERQNTGESMVPGCAWVQSECISTAGPNASVPLVSDYTTMELFQQISKAQLQTPSPSDQESNASKAAPLKAGQDYIRQVLSHTQNQQDERSYQ